MWYQGKENGQVKKSYQKMRRQVLMMKLKVIIKINFINIGMVNLKMVSCMAKVTDIELKEVN